MEFIVKGDDVQFFCSGHRRLFRIWAYFTNNSKFNMCRKHFLLDSSFLVGHGANVFITLVIPQQKHFLQTVTEIMSTFTVCCWLHNQSRVHEVAWSWPWLSMSQNVYCFASICWCHYACVWTVIQLLLTRGCHPKHTTYINSVLLSNDMSIASFKASSPQSECLNYTKKDDIKWQIMLRNWMVEADLTKWQHHETGKRYCSLWMWQDQKICVDDTWG
jgi:hypothetical protein